jgi:hypothetical protein
VVKICARCYVVWAGGYRCEDCGGPLVHTSDAAAREMPEAVWKNQRLDYGARRGMIFRFMGIFAGLTVALLGVRSSVAQPSPWSWVMGIGSIVAGIALWRLLYVAADRGVRIWILRSGQLQKGKLARAILQQAVTPTKRP